MGNPVTYGHSLWLRGCAVVYPAAPSAAADCRQERTMGLRTVGCIVTLILSLLAAPLATDAQPAGKIPRIGVLHPGVPPVKPGRGADRFFQALRDLGYI